MNTKTEPDQVISLAKSLDLPRFRAWAYLKEFGEWPADIDRSWMRDFSGAYNDSVVTRAVIGELAFALAGSQSLRSALAQIIEADDAQTLTQAHIDVGRDALQGSPALQSIAKRSLQGLRATMLKDLLADAFHGLQWAVETLRTLQTTQPENTQAPNVCLDKNRMNHATALLSEIRERLGDDAPVVSGEQSLRIVARQLRTELEAIIGWNKIEKAPLRPQELAHIEGVLAETNNADALRAQPGLIEVSRELFDMAVDAYESAGADIQHGGHGHVPQWARDVIDAAPQAWLEPSENAPQAASPGL